MAQVIGRFNIKLGKMSLIGRVRHHLSYGSLKKICSPVVATCSCNSIGVTRHFAQPAMLREEVEIDQRMLPTDYDPATFDPTDHRSPPTERVWRLVDEVSGLTQVQALELSDIMMEKFCDKMMKKLSFKERYVIRMMRPDAASVSGAAKEGEKPGKTTFQVRLESYEAASKLKIIKEIRGLMDLGLKEAKDLVEKSPAILKRGVLKEEAEKIIEKMKAIGAKVVME